MPEWITVCMLDRDRDRMIDLEVCVPYPPRVWGLDPFFKHVTVEDTVDIKDDKLVRGKVGLSVAGYVARQLMGERVGNVWDGRSIPILGALYRHEAADLWFVAAYKSYSPQSRREYLQLTREEAGLLIDANRYAHPDVAERPKTPPPLSIEGNVVTVNGKSYPLDDGPAAFVRKLVEKGVGDWISGPNMGQLVQPNPSRIHKRIGKDYPEIKAWIEAATFKGFRLRPPPVPTATT
jgi:hypothetical protein